MDSEAAAAHVPTAPETERTRRPPTPPLLIPLPPSRAGWIVLGLILVYFLGVAWLSPGRAIGDDQQIELTAQAAAAAPSAAGRWALLAAQQDEHRPVVTRLAFLAVQGLPESLRYTALALLGGVFLVILFAVLEAERRRIGAQAAFGVVLAGLLLSFASAEASLWAHAALAGFGVLAMAAASLWLLSRRGWPAWMAPLPALLAMGLQGNGLLVFTLGSAYLMFSGRYALAFVWLAIAALAGLWYFEGYVRPVSGIDAEDWGLRAGDMLLYVLAFCGSAVAYGGANIPEPMNLFFVWVAAGLGASLIGATAVGVIRGGLMNGRIELWLNIFVIASGFAAAVFRLNQGLQQALSSRYHINSCLMVAATLMFFLGEKGTTDPTALLLRGRARTMAALALAFFAATAPILIWVHRAYAPEAAPSDAQPIQPSWDPDRAALPAAPAVSSPAARPA